MSAGKVAAAGALVLLLLVGGAASASEPEPEGGGGPDPEPGPDVEPEGGEEPLPDKVCPPGYTPTGPGGGCIDADGNPPGWGLSGGASSPEKGGFASNGEAVLEKYLSSTPAAGRLYQIRKGDTGLGVAGLVVGQTGRAAYLRRMTSVDYNRRYSVPQGQSPNWPAYTAYDGRVLSRAFLPQNEDVQAIVRAGQTPTGAAGKRFALIWCPDLSGDPNPPAELAAVLGA